MRMFGHRGGLCAKLTGFITTRHRASTNESDTTADFMAFSLSRLRRILKACLSSATPQPSPKE